MQFQMIRRYNFARHSDVKHLSLQSRELFSIQKISKIKHSTKNKMQNQPGSLIKTVKKNLQNKNKIRKFNHNLVSVCFVIALRNPNARSVQNSNWRLRIFYCKKFALYIHFCKALRQPCTSFLQKPIVTVATHDEKGVRTVFEDEKDEWPAAQRS